MVKSYLRYEHTLSIGVITSTDSNISHDSTCRLLLSPSLDKISTWDLRKGILSKPLAPGSNPSRNLVVSSIYLRSSRLVSEHAGGSVRGSDLAKVVCEATLDGHNLAVTVLRFNAKGAVLALGSKDRDLIVYDVVGEAGLYRFRAHPDQVLLSSSSVVAIEQDEASALLQFKLSSIDLDPKGSMNNWTNATAICSWIGVIYSQLERRIHSLNLSNMGLAIFQKKILSHHA